MSSHIGDAISESGTVKNLGVAVGLALPAFPFKIYFHFRFVGRHSEFPMPGRVGSVTFDSCMVENGWVPVEIASPAPSVKELFPLPVCWPPF